MTRRARGSALGAALLAVALAAAGRAGAQVADVPALQIDREMGAAKELALEVGQNRLLVLSEAIGRVSVASPEIADLKVVTANQLLLIANKVGATYLTIWNKQDVPLVMSLQVTRNLEALRRQLKELFPGEPITVSSSGELVVLSGEVSDVRLPSRAVEVARLQADKVANLIRVSGNQQVQLEVKFAEVSRNGLREMAINFFHKNNPVNPRDQRAGGVASSKTFPGGFIDVPGTGGANPPVYPGNFATGFSIFLSDVVRDFPFSAMLSLLESNGMGKILAEPTLVAMSGQEARFLAGGEFPIPLTSSLGQVAVQFKKFGILLNFTPTVIGDGTIHLKLAAEVSDIDQTASISFGGVTIPGLFSRQSETTVRLGDGQSFAIAGLLSDKVRSQVDRIPLLGDIPILGALFRSTEYRRDETELLVVVTARLVRPLAPHEVPALPTDDEDNDPNDVELFLLGSQGSARRAKAQGQQPAGTSPRPEGRGPSGELGFIR